MILDVTTVNRDLDLTADAVVIGSGAGGSVVAATLQAAGLETIVLEEGAYVTSRDFDQREEDRYVRLYRERGTKPTADFAVLVSQGRAVGGSTIVSHCLCFRPPRQILADWRERHGVSGLDFEAIFPHVQHVERAIGVEAMGPQHLNANNAILMRGSERLGYRGRFVDHNRKDCLGCGYCALGCAYDRKGDALGTFLAEASRRGACIVPETRVERIVAERGVAVGVDARLRRTRDGKPRAVRIRAANVVLSAGALESPMLWRRSKLPDRANAVGKNLHLQPHLIVAGLFEAPVRAWEGVPQSYVVDEFLNLDKSLEGGWLTFAASAQPVATAAMLPGVGAGHRELMRRFADLGAVAVFLHDRTAGEVRADRRGRPVLHYELGEEDRRDALEALRQASDILFAAGASRVVLPFNDAVELASRDDRRLIDEHGIHPNDPLFLSFHPQGTMRMGDDPDRSVVDPVGAAHEVRRLWVADASVFPTSVAVPPQVTVMSLAARTAGAVLAANGAKPAS